MLENSYRYKNKQTGATLILSAPLHDKTPVHSGYTEPDWQARDRQGALLFWLTILAIALAVLGAAFLAGRMV